MTAITLPSTGLKRARMRLVGADRSLGSFTGASVIVESVEFLWALDFSLNPQDGATARAWKSALTQLSRLSNTFDYAPPEYSGNSAGYSGADPLVKGASQLGLSVDADGVTSSTAIAKEGDYIEVGGELKILTADADSDGTGNVTFTFFPPLRSSPSDNAVIEIDAPKATFRMITSAAGWDLSPPLWHEFSVQAVESF